MNRMGVTSRTPTMICASHSRLVCIGVAAALHLSASAPLLAQPAGSPPETAPAAAPSLPRSSERAFGVAYEISEMSINGFRNFAGEMRYRFGERHQVRLSVMEVKVTERDLAGWWSAAVSGGGVKGYFRAYELHGDRFVKGHWYLSANVGYIANTFEHVTLHDRVTNRTPTAGLGIGYARSNLFGVRGLSINITNPVRYYFHEIRETKLGAATVRAHKLVPNTWLFVGFEF